MSLKDLIASVRAAEELQSAETRIRRDAPEQVTVTINAATRRVDIIRAKLARTESAADRMVELINAPRLPDRAEIEDVLRELADAIDRECTKDWWSD